MVGCVQSINQCGRSIQTCVSRKNRRRVPRDIQERYNTTVGARVLRQLLDFAISELQACAWRDDFWIGAPPIKRRQRTISEAGKRIQRAGKAKGKEQREAARKARFAKEAA